MSVPDFPALGEPFTFFAMIWPTLTRRDDQTILAQWDAAAGTGLHIGLKAGGFVTITTASLPDATPGTPYTRRRT